MKMTSKEALLYLATADRNLEICDEAKDILWELVERDTPMIPISESIELICPKCGEEQHTNTARFCSECGQRLDWSSNLR